MNSSPDYADTPLARWPLTLNGEYVFQDVDQWGPLYAGSPAGGLYNDPCDRLALMGRPRR